MHVISKHSKQILNHEEIILHVNKMEKVDHFKCLGIWINKNLNWKKNTNEKCKNIAQLLAIINKNQATATIVHIKTTI